MQIQGNRKLRLWYIWGGYINAVKSNEIAAIVIPYKAPPTFWEMFEHDFWD